MKIKLERRYKIAMRKQNDKNAVGKRLGRKKKFVKMSSIYKEKQTERSAGTSLRRQNSVEL